MSKSLRICLAVEVELKENQGNMTDFRKSKLLGVDQTDPKRWGDQGYL